MNTVQLIGNLTRDPELRYTQTNNKPVCNFTVAIDQPAGANGEKYTDYPKVKVFGVIAENCNRYLAKGSKVGVEGRISTGKYQNKDGQTIYTTEVIASRVEFLDRREDRQEANRAQMPEQNNGYQQSPPWEQERPRQWGEPNAYGESEPRW